MATIPITGCDLDRLVAVLTGPEDCEEEFAVSLLLIPNDEDSGGLKPEWCMASTWRTWGAAQIGSCVGYKAHQGAARVAVEVVYLAHLGAAQVKLLRVEWAHLATGRCT